MLLKCASTPSFLSAGGFGDPPREEVTHLHSRSYTPRRVEQLYADWKAYYRSLIPAAIFMWQTCVMIGALFLDLSLIHI